MLNQIISSSYSISYSLSHNQCACMQAVNSHGEKVWSEEMVSYSDDAERKDRKAVQREMAQSSKA